MQRAPGPARRGRRRGRAAHAPGRLLARRLDERLLRARRAARARGARCCSTAPRASAPCPWTWTSSAATPTRAPGRSGCAAPTAPACCSSAPRLRERLEVSRRGYSNLAKPDAGLDAGLHDDARRFDAASLSAEAAGLRAGRRLAAGVRRLARRARARRRTLRGAVRRARWPSAGASRPRAGQTTLVSFRQRGPRGRARAPRAGGDRAAQHPRAAVAAGVGGGLERRERPRTAAGRARVSATPPAAAEPSGLAPGAPARGRPAAPRSSRGCSPPTPGSCWWRRCGWC